MGVTEWSLRARKADLSFGPMFQDWTGQLVNRCNFPDTLQVTGRSDHLKPLFTASDGTLDVSGGAILDDGNGRRFSGFITNLKRGKVTSTITFTSDLMRIWPPLVYPTPSQPITNQTTDYGDVRTGPAETVLLGYINANAGPGALLARRVPGLVIPTSAGRGGTASRTSRLDILGPLVAELAEAAALRVNVLQDGSSLLVTVDDMPDLSATAKYGTPDHGGPGMLGEDWEYEITRPAINVAEVAGGGEGTLRKFRERIDADSVAIWGRIEGLVDQRQTTDNTELDKAGDDELAGAAQPVAITAAVLDEPGRRLGVDVPMGALLTLDLDDGLRIVDRLRQVTTTFAVNDGEKSVSVEGVVGSVDAGLTQDQKDFIAQRKLLRKGSQQ